MLYYCTVSWHSDSHNDYHFCVLIDINECSDPSACGVLEDCVNSPGSFICICQDGYERNNVTDECEGILLIMVIVYIIIYYYIMI